MQSTAGPIRLVIVGATGMAGGYALRYALGHHSVERVTSIGRKNIRLAPQAERGSAPGLCGLLCTRGGAFRSRRGDLLPGRIYRSGEFSDFGTAFYHSAVNYTSLGYGDLIMTPSWRLLGPLETANGTLLFGVSTAMIFAAMLWLIQARFTDLKP